MVETPTSQRQMSTLKICLIPVLAVVLALILFWPNSDGSEPPEEPTGSEGQNTATEARIAVSLKSWPRIELDSILRHDPFAPATRLQTPPPSSPPKEQDDQIKVSPDERDRRVAELLKKRAQVVYRSNSGMAALIDSKVVREGDLLDDGVRVLKIRADGVTLELAD